MLSTTSISLAEREPAGSIHESVHAVVALDGYELKYTVWSGANPAFCSVLLLNGLMSHSGWFRPLALDLARCGAKVIGADRRGSGLNDRDRGDAPSALVLVEDVRSIMRNEACGIPTYVAGWCWGAVLAVNAVLEFRNDVEGLVLLAPGLYPSGAIKARVKDQSELCRVVDRRSAVLSSPVTKEMFSNLAKIRKFIETDDRAVRAFTPNFFRIAAEMSLIATARLTQLSSPALLILASNDEAVDNSQTLSAFQRVRAVSITTAVVTGNHAVQLEDPNTVGRLITQWLTDQEAQSAAAIDR